MDDPNYANRQEVMALYRAAQDMQGRIVNLRKTADDSHGYLSTAYENATAIMNTLSHWLHELDKGALMVTVDADIVQLQLTEPEQKMAARRDKGIDKPIKP